MEYLAFWATFAVLFFIIVYSDYKFHMLRDVGDGSPRPYSYSRVQLAWWTLVVLSSIISILIFRGQIPNLLPSTLVLLGISSATTATATMIDLKDKTKVSPADPTLLQNQQGENFFYDILSDKNDVSIHRLQAVILNLTYGCWFISQVLSQIKAGPINQIIPDISNTNLALLGLSAGVYASLKTTENKQPLLPNQNNPAGVNQLAANQPALNQQT